MPIFVLYWVLCLLCWGYALVHGGAAARWTFALFVCASIGTFYATPFDSGLTTFDDVNTPLFVTDAGYFIGLYALALGFRKYWLVWSAGLQLMCVLTHIGPLLDPYSDPRIYRALESVWMMPMLITMVIGIARDRRAVLIGTAVR